MKYAREILGLMRPYPGREFRMAQLVRCVSAGRTLSPRRLEAVRKGVRRVLDDLVEAGMVERVGGNTKSAAYAWRGLGHRAPERPCALRHQLGQ